MQVPVLINEYLWVLDFNKKKLFSRKKSWSKIIKNSLQNYIKKQKSSKFSDFEKLEEANMITK